MYCIILYNYYVQTREGFKPIVYSVNGRETEEYKKQRMYNMLSSLSPSAA
jgi:hypothetical protein